ncbi:hypothetical protein EDD37DRAFT_147650 [Exophiala viscosa]|uniref:uncharacterized protein n=1 Tax=Exophiala viscosa TaxID=2486360 RepID=UPI00219E9ED8|nr:hypothetical protein EDD37DRAFT_147650 [Exophiala viscosa]
MVNNDGASCCLGMDMSCDDSHGWAAVKLQRPRSSQTQTACRQGNHCKVWPLTAGEISNFRLCSCACCFGPAHLRLTNICPQTTFWTFGQRACRQPSCFGGFVPEEAFLGRDCRQNRLDWIQEGDLWPETGKDTRQALLQVQNPGPVRQWNWGSLGHNWLFSTGAGVLFDGVCSVLHILKCCSCIGVNRSLQSARFDGPESENMEDGDSGLIRSEGDERNFLAFFCESRSDFNGESGYGWRRVPSVMTGLQPD